MICKKANYRACVLSVVAVASFLMIGVALASDSSPWGYMDPSYTRIAQGADAGYRGLEQTIQARTGEATTITPELEKMLNSVPDTSRLSIFVDTRRQADLTTLPLGSSRADKIAYLKSVAAEAQRGILDFVAKENIQDVTSFWLTSRVFLRATPAEVRELAQRSDVALVDLNCKFRMPSSSIQRSEPHGADRGRLEADPVGPYAIKAEQCWAQGYTGGGVVVGMISTGIDTSQGVFKNDDGTSRLRSSPNWFDAIDYPPINYPFDDNGEGTECMGLMAGCRIDSYNPHDTVGVAPGAQFVCARAWNANYQSNPYALDQSFEWMANVGPNVVCCPWDLGLTYRDSLYCWEDILQLQFLGIVVVSPIGTYGPDSNTSATPGSFPTVISVGETGWNWWYLDPWSSLGPAPQMYPWNQTASWPRRDWNYTNPTVTAPGDTLIVPLANTPGEAGVFTGPDGSSALAAGAIALLLQKYRNLSPTEVFNMVADNADKQPGYNYPINGRGWGGVDCANLLAAAPVKTETLAFTNSPLATYPTEARHLVRTPNSEELHAVYQSGGMIYYQRSPDGTYWYPAECLGPGRSPSVSLDFNNLPWVCYVSATSAPDSIYCSVKRSEQPGDWNRILVIWHSVGTFGTLSMVCSNFGGGGSGSSSGPDIGYLAFANYYPGGPGPFGVVPTPECCISFTSFDTLNPTLYSKPYARYNCYC
jgi:hypothetical protein